MNEMNRINDNNYQEWVERFLNADTTLEEEREIYAYFSRPDLPAEAGRYRRMFGWYDSITTKAPYQPLQTSALSISAQKHRTLRILPLHPWQWAGVAAAIAILFAVGLNLRSNSSDSIYSDSEGYIYSGYIMHDGKKTTDITLVSAEVDRIDRDIASRLAAMDSHMDTYSEQIQKEIAASFDMDNPQVRELVETALEL